MLSLTRKTLILSFACVLASFSTLVLAEEFQVKLIATLDNGPALEAIKWTVYRNGTEKIKEARNHLTRITVPPGRYTAEAKLLKNGIVRKRDFYVKNNTKVVVPMDH